MSFPKDFINIKRNFYTDENLCVIVKMATLKDIERYSKFLVMRMYDESGSLVAEEMILTEPNMKGDYAQFKLPPSTRSFPGLYTIHAILTNHSDEYTPIGEKHKVEKIQIISR